MICVSNVTSVSGLSILDWPFSFSKVYLLLRYVLLFVYPMLPVSLDSPFLISPSVFSNVYLLPMVCPVLCISNVASVSVLSIFDWPLRFSLTFVYYLRYVMCLVYPMFPVSLDCPFLIAPSVFSNVYLLPIVCPVSCVLNVANISGLSILDCSFGFL